MGKIECNAPTPPFILKTSTFPAAGCAGNAITIRYFGSALGCRLPIYNNSKNVPGRFELDGDNLTSKAYVMRNDTTCSGESFGEHIFQRNVCDDANATYDFYQAPVKASCASRTCETDGWIPKPEQVNATCTDNTCTDSFCCQAKKDSGAFPSAPLAGMLVALCLHVGSAFA